MKGLVKTPLTGVPREEWLKMRRQSIGGSDAAAIIGLNPYSSPFSIWADKTGRLPEKEDNEAMRQGRDFEDYVARRWTEVTEKKVRRDNAILRNPVYPFAHADIDRWVVGENAGLECKTTSVMNLKKFKNGEYPDNFYCQCMHYMAVTGADRWYLAVLVLNQGFYEYTIERDDDEIAALMAQESEFWKLVENDTPPPPDGSDATGAALKEVYPLDEEKPPVYLYGNELKLDELDRLKSEKKVLDSRISEINNELIALLQGAPKGILNGYEITLQTICKKPYTVMPKPYTALRIKEVKL